MIDIPKLARESGASRGVVAGLDWWRFSPDELQLYTEKVMLAAQAAERDRANELVEALEWIANRYDSHKAMYECAADAYEMACKARAAIAKYEGEK
jgi:hypothetical protein